MAQKELEDLPNEILSHILSYLDRRYWCGISQLNNRFYGLRNFPCRSLRLLLWNLTLLPEGGNTERPSAYGVDESMYRTWTMPLVDIESMAKLISATGYISLLEIVFNSSDCDIPVRLFEPEDNFADPEPGNTSLSQNPALRLLLDQISEENSTERYKLFKVLRVSCGSPQDLIQVSSQVQSCKQIILSDCNLDFSAFEALKSLANLETLRLDKSKLPSIISDQKIVLPPSLKVLTGISYPIIFESLAQLPLLEVLQFKDVDFTTALVFGRITRILCYRNVPKLKTVYFFSCRFSWSSLDDVSHFTRSLRKVQTCFSSMQEGVMEAEMMMFTRRLLRETVPSCKKLEIVVYPRLVRSFYDNLLPYLVRNGITLHMGCYYSKFDWDGTSIPAPKCLGEVLKHISYSFTDYEPGSWDTRPYPRLSDRNAAASELRAVFQDLIEAKQLKTIYFSAKMLPNSNLSAPDVPLDLLAQISLPKLRSIRIRTNSYPIGLALGLEDFVPSFVNQPVSERKLKINLEPLDRAQEPFDIADPIVSLKRPYPLVGWRRNTFPTDWKLHVINKESSPKNKRVIVWKDKTNMVYLKNYYDCVEGKVPLMDVFLKNPDIVNEE